VPATRELVDRFLATVTLPPEAPIARMPPRNRSCTVEKAAINAVMAGCRPEYFPVVVTALQAMNEEAFNFFGSSASTGGSAHLVVVNGPLRRDLGMNSDCSVYGPGNRANATIGRAVRLVIMNVFGMQPGVTDRSTQGHPGKYSYCIAEDEEVSPWEPWHVEQGVPAQSSAVTVFAGEGPHNILSHDSEVSEGILLCMADTLACLGSFSAGQSVLVIAPEHAEMLKCDGWDKPAIRTFVYEHARRTVADLKRAGKMAGPLEPGDETAYRHRGESADDIMIIVAGGTAGGHSTFIPSWSRGRASIRQTKAVTCAVP
jgi:hypothetical protein